MVRNAVRFDLSKCKGCSIKSFVIRELNGEDELTAAQLADAKGADGKRVDELIRLSLAEVDDKATVQPYLPYDRWNSRTRAFVFAAWKQVNLVEEDEVKDFLASAEPLAVSSANGRSEGGISERSAMISAASGPE